MQGIVILFSRCHKSVVEIPEDLYCGREMYEQDLINGRINAGNIHIRDLGWKYNCMNAFKQDMRESYIAHFAGGRPFDERIPLIEAVESHWREQGL